MAQCAAAEWAGERGRLLNGAAAAGWQRAGGTPLSAARSLALSPTPASPYARLSGLFGATPGAGKVQGVTGRLLANSSPRAGSVQVRARLPTSRRSSPPPAHSPLLEPHHNSSGPPESPAGSPFPGPDGQPQLSPVQAALVAAAGRLVDARNAGAAAAFDAVAECRAALALPDAPGDPSHGRIGTVWDIVAAQVAAVRAAAPVDAGAGCKRDGRKGWAGAEAPWSERCVTPAVPASGSVRRASCHSPRPRAVSKQKAQLRGSLTYLETCYLDHVAKAVAENRYAAQPGGSGSRGALVRAFLASAAARPGAAAAHPSDAGFGWHVVHQCLRAGLVDEALVAASDPAIGPRAAPRLAAPARVAAGLAARGAVSERGVRARGEVEGGALQGLEGGSGEARSDSGEEVKVEVLMRGECVAGRAPTQRRAQVAAQCAAAMRQPEVAGNAPLARAAALVLCTLAGSARAMAAACEAVPRLRETALTSIEDFLWLRCHAAHAELSHRDAGAGWEGRSGTRGHEPGA